MSKIVPDSAGTGNTKQSRQENPKKAWCLTLNNYNEQEYNDLIKYFSANGKYIIGKEKGDKCQTNHLQIYYNSASKIRFTCLKKINSRLHIESARGSEKDNLIYCSKDGNYKTNYPKSCFRKLKLISPEIFYDWQKEVINIISKEPDNRTINWFWDPKGCVGKTQFCKYLSHNYNAILLDGKKNDMLYVASICDSDLYIFSFSRSIENYVSYDSIEKIKDGYYMNGKFEGQMIIRPEPHIFVFANFPPEMDKLSLDRWNIKKVCSATPSPPNPTALETLRLNAAPPVLVGGVEGETINYSESEGGESKETIDAEIDFLYNDVKKAHDFILTFD